MASCGLDFLEAAYAWEKPEERWLKEVLDAAIRSWGAAPWACAFIYDASDVTWFTFRRMVFSDDSTRPEPFLNGLSELPPEFIARMYRTVSIGFGRPVGVDIDIDPMFRELCAAGDAGAFDAAGDVEAGDAAGSGDANGPRGCQDTPTPCGTFGSGQQAACTAADGCSSRQSCSGTTTPCQGSGREHARSATTPARHASRAATGDGRAAWTRLRRINGGPFESLRS